MRVSDTYAAIAARFGDWADAVSPFLYAQSGRHDLIELFRDLGCRRGAEIGVWRGGFSARMCERVPGLALLAVDWWAPYAAYRERKNDPAALDAAHAETCERLAPYGATVLRMTSLAAAEQVPDRSLDFVYIDANHELPYVTADLKAWTPKVRAGGILGGHDYRPPSAERPFIQVQAAVDAFVRTRAIAPWFILAGDRTPSFFWVVQ